MFGSSNPFGQSSNSPFGSQSVFGQANNASSNPFAPKPLGSTTPFGSQTGGSIFGGTSSGIFGATQSSSPLTSTSAFGASSAPAFGGSMSAFGASSSPSFGSSSVFGQKSAFGGFGSSTTQTSPFGSTLQQSQPAFGSSLFGSSTPFGAPSQPTSGVLCDKRIPTRLKGKFYRTAIRLAMLYGTECWANKKQHVDRMSVAEMRMLRWMCGKTRQDRIMNECIREWVGVALIEDKLRENRLRWFGHIQWRLIEAVVKRCDAVTVDGSIRGRGKLRLTLASVVNRDMDLLNLTNKMVFDRTAWRRRIHVTDPI